MKMPAGLMASGRFCSVDYAGSPDKTLMGPKPQVGDKLLALCTGLASEAASRKPYMGYPPPLSGLTAL